MQLLVLLSMLAVVDGCDGRHTAHCPAGQYGYCNTETSPGVGGCKACPWCTGGLVESDDPNIACRPLGGGTTSCTVAGCADAPNDPSKCCRQGCWADVSDQIVKECPVGSNNVGADSNSADSGPNPCVAIPGYVGYNGMFEWLLQQSSFQFGSGWLYLSGALLHRG
jgi:hypothetical protein